MLTVVMSSVGGRLKQGPNGDTEMEFLLKSFSDITPLETTHCLPHTCVNEYFILWNSRILVLKGREKERGDWSLLSACCGLGVLSVGFNRAVTPSISQQFLIVSALIANL